MFIDSAKIKIKAETAERRSHSSGEYVAKGGRTAGMAEGGSVIFVVN